MTLQPEQIIAKHSIKKGVMIMKLSIVLNHKQLDSKFRMISHEDTGNPKLIFVDEQYYLIANIDALENLEDVRMLGGKIRKKVQEINVSEVEIYFYQLIEVLSHFSEEELVTAFMEGWYLASYQFNKYTPVKSKENITTVFSKREYITLAKKAITRANAVNVARDLCNEPANKLTPAIYAERIESLFKTTKATVEIIGQEDLIDRGFIATEVVGRGSSNAAGVAIISLKNNPSDASQTALVGKGVTFDTGGTNVKTARDIGEMKMDMGGSAAVVGAMKLLADMDADVNVTGILPLVTNVAGSRAYLPSDIIEYDNGKVVEVGNTDAEGRLILADGILYAQKIGAKTIIDIATLTGAIGGALGLKYAGIFSTNERQLWHYKTLGERCGDYIWPMPLVEDYYDYLKSTVAHINNMSSSSYGGAITAAMFLKSFVSSECDWVHIDMANTVRPWKEQGYYVPGASGFGVRLLTEMILNKELVE
ncbi:M17 family metallopeptidase [Gracilibacillus oryzae]|nr:leucyl aminopeptidase family protein [Gracilibacillus oryzae]